MLEYYSSVLPFNHTVDELIEVMKPWYDNYCFAIKRYGKTTMYNSVMVLNFLDKYIRNDYEIPDALDGVEKLAKVSLAVSLFQVSALVSLVGKNLIGEVVVLIDEEIDFLTYLSTLRA